MSTNRVNIIGAGISGISLAQLLANNGYEVHIYERKEHIGGNCYDFCSNKNILIHKYGPHIFHTSNERVWAFVNQFAKFNDYINQVLVTVGDKKVWMPICYQSIEQLFDANIAKDFIKECQEKFNEQSVSIFDIKNKLKSKNAAYVADFIYKNIYENYTTKMWGIPVEQIDSDILKRVKINLNYEWNYFPNDKYQGLPIKGYTKMLLKMLDHENIHLHLNCNAIDKLEFKKDNILIDGDDSLLIYTGAIDELFNYKFKGLEYRSLFIEFSTYCKKSYQEAGVVNYPADPNITRITEYKKLTKQKKKNWTIISTEKPGEYQKDSPIFNIPFYPINSEANNKKLAKYLEQVSKYKNLRLLGRLATFKYIDMDDAIEEAFKLFEEITNKNTESI